MSDARGRLLTDDELADLKRRADEVAADHFGPGMVELCVEELDALLAHARALAERVAALEGELVEERRWHQEFRTQYLAARDVVAERNERVAALEAALNTAHRALDDTGCALTARGHPGWPNWDDPDADAAFAARDAIERALDGAPVEGGDAQAALLAAQEWERWVAALEDVRKAAREVVDHSYEWSDEQVYAVIMKIPRSDWAALTRALDGARAEAGDA